MQSKKIKNVEKDETKKPVREWAGFMNSIYNQIKKQKAALCYLKKHLKNRKIKG